MDTPVPPAQVPVSRSSQVALAAFGLVVLALLLFRGYGSQVGARPTERHAPAVAHRVDLNTAEKAELLQLDGVGPAMADAILAHRRDHGRFDSVEALTDVHGIGPKTLDKLRPWVTVTDRRDSVAPDTVERLERKPAPSATRRTGKLQPGDPPINVNTATEAELTQLPGVGPVTAQKIIDARGREPFKVPDDLRRVKGIGVKIMDGIRPFVKCN
jgi:competence protein ComEA